MDESNTININTLLKVLDDTIRSLDDNDSMHRSM